MAQIHVGEPWNTNSKLAVHMHAITKVLKGSQKIITFTIVTDGLKAASYDAVQILICPLFIDKMVVRTDNHVFSLRNDAPLDTTTYIAVVR